MKQKITNIFVLFITLLNSCGSIAADREHIPTEKLAGVTTLVVNARVNIVLVNSAKPILKIDGKSALHTKVFFERKGNTLVINAEKSKDFRNAGTIYISANEFNKIEVNTPSEIRTLNTLENSILDVYVNSECQFKIHNIGSLNVIPNRNYVVEGSREERLIPTEVFRNSKKYAF